MEYFQGEFVLQK